MTIKKHKTKQFIENLPIQSMSSGGKGIGRIDNKVVFVDKAITGDVVDIEIINKKKSYSEASVLKIKESSEFRIAPACSSFGICGGCNLQNSNYIFQLRFKQNLVFEDLNRIGQQSNFEMKEIIGAQKHFYYRNKLEYSFSVNPWYLKNFNFNDDKRVLGFHVKGRFDKIIDVEECLLQENPSNLIRNTIREIAKLHNLDFYNIKTNIGFIRSLFIRITTTNQVMISLVFSKDENVIITNFLNEIINKINGLSSVYYFINEKVNESIYDLTPKLFFGNRYIFEKLGHINVHIGPKSFLQTNSYQALILYDTIKKICKLKTDDIVYDLYCGVGSIGLFLAKYVKKVIGVETVEESIVEANLNKELNKIENIAFFQGMVEKVFTNEFAIQNGLPNLVILDPPRAGLHKNTIDSLLSVAPVKIVYVSCNPATQARDILLLSEKYQLTVAQPIDMFPQTLHVENIALLEKK